MRPPKVVPPYIYEEPEDKNSLYQGDIISISGSLRLRFKCYYPKIVHEMGEKKYAMVLSQSCDLVRRSFPESPGKLELPGLSHISLCLIRPIESTLNYELKISGAKKTDGFHMMTSAQFAATLTKVSRLINNSEAKNVFFLPKKPGVLDAESVALLNLSFSFRTSCYEEVLKNRVASVRPEFRAKIGFLLADYFGRVATGDLSDEQWTQEDLIKYARRILHRAGIVDALDSRFMNKMKKTKFSSPSEIEEAVRKFTEEEEVERIDKIVRSTTNSNVNIAYKILRDQAELTRLQALNDIDLRKELRRLLSQ